MLVAVGSAMPVQAELGPWLLLALLGPLGLPQTGALADCSECTSTSLNFKSTFQSPIITNYVLIASPALQIKVQPVV